jgi:hypothetical protein
MALAPMLTLPTHEEVGAMSDEKTYELLSDDSFPVLEMDPFTPLMEFEVPPDAPLDVPAAIVPKKFRPETIAQRHGVSNIVRTAAWMHLLIGTQIAQHTPAEALAHMYRSNWEFDVGGKKLTLAQIIGRIKLQTGHSNDQPTQALLEFFNQPADADDMQQWGADDMQQLATEGRDACVRACAMV